MRYLAMLFVPAVVVLAPNLVWLGASTVRIENASGTVLQSVSYSACEKTHHLGVLQPGEARFRFLEACADDTLEVVLDGAGYCQTYVEAELYHVDASIGGPADVVCTYDDLFSTLFVRKFVW